MPYFSDKRLALEKEKNDIYAKISMLDEIEEHFKNVIQKQISISKEFDGTGHVWINSFALLGRLDLEEWNFPRNEKIASGVDEINEINKVDALVATGEGDKNDK